MFQEYRYSEARYKHKHKCIYILYIFMLFKIEINKNMNEKFHGCRGKRWMKRNWNEGLWVVCQHVDLTLLYESRYDSPLLDLQTPWPLHASADSFNDTLCDDSPVLDLRTLTAAHTRRHLQRHPVWQPPRNESTKVCERSLEVRTPIAKAISGKATTPKTLDYLCEIRPLRSSGFDGQLHNGHPVLVKHSNIARSH